MRLRKPPTMDALDAVFHIAGFGAPALAVALLVALAARVIMPRQVAGRSWWVHAAINLIVGVVVLVAGLWYFGVDGKMATYGALVLAVATCQWVASRSWQG